MDHPGESHYPSLPYPCGTSSPAAAAFVSPVVTAHASPHNDPLISPQGLLSLHRELRFRAASVAKC